MGAGESEGEEPVDGPASEVRARAARTLRIVTRLRGEAAASAVVTVTDAVGRVHYEGPLAEDGTVSVALAGSRAEIFRILLETARWHRQADVAVGADCAEHSFG